MVIYKFISNRYVQFLVKRVGLSNWFYELTSKKLLNLHLKINYFQKFLKRLYFIIQFYFLN